MSIKKMAVIGSGLMGHGIALVAAASGQDVTLIDISDALLAKALQKIEESATRLAAKGKISDSPDKVLKRIKTTTNLPDGVKDADFVIEAVPEDINLKKKILNQVDLHIPSSTILATNTSGLSVKAISEAVKDKSRVIGMHWFNPPQLMRLVEIIRSEYTSDATLETTLGLCRLYGKETIIAQKDVWGFLANRSHGGWGSEASLMYLLKEADLREIDAFARYRVGLPMGPFELMDFTGIAEIRSKGLESVESIMKSDPAFEPWPAFLAINKYLVDHLWISMMKQGLSGVKTGKGFYTYPGAKYAKPEIPENLADRVNPLELLAPAINTAAWCVTNGVGSVEDVNKSFKLAYNWPKGIFEFLNEYKTSDIIAVLKKKAKRAPDEVRDFYKVDPLLSGHGS